MPSTLNIKNSSNNKGNTVDEQTHQLLQMLNTQSYNKKSHKQQPQDNIKLKKQRLENAVTENNSNPSNGNGFVDSNDNTYNGIDLTDDSMYDQQQHNASTDNGGDVLEVS